jgi:hypothetical protein
MKTRTSLQSRRQHLEFGGKRSATPLWIDFPQRGNPKRRQAGALQMLPLASQVGAFRFS